MRQISSWPLHDDRDTTANLLQFKQSLINAIDSTAAAEEYFMFLRYVCCGSQHIDLIDDRDFDPIRPNPDEMLNPSIVLGAYGLIWHHGGEVELAGRVGQEHMAFLRVV